MFIEMFEAMQQSNFERKQHRSLKIKIRKSRKCLTVEIGKSIIYPYVLHQTANPFLKQLKSIRYDHEHLCCILIDCKVCFVALRAVYFLIVVFSVLPMMLVFIQTNNCTVIRKNSVLGFLQTLVCIVLLCSKLKRL